MDRGNYWQRRSTRRSLLRAGGIGAVGLAGAGLIGCGEDDAPPTAPGDDDTGPIPADPSQDGPLALERAPGFPGEEFGRVDVNTKPRIMGGTYTMAGGGRAWGGRELDPDVSGFCAPAEFVTDSLVQPRPGWTEELAFDVLEDFEWADDLELILRIRPNIQSHDRPPTNGRIVTAEDVAYSFNRKGGVLDADAARGYPRRAYLTGLGRADAIDDVTVSVKLDSPNASMLAGWGDIRQNVQLVELDDWDFSDMTTFPGFGAWFITEDTDGVRGVAEKHPGYYRADEEGGRPSFDRMILQAYPDRSASIAAFITGEVDDLQQVNPHELAQIESSVPDALWYRSPMSTITHTNVNINRVPAFQDQRVRQAWHYSRDFVEINDPISAPGWQYSGPFHPMHDFSLSSNEIRAMPGYNPDTKEEDIAEARRLMEAAGYPEGEGISFGFMSSGAAGRNFESGERVRNQLVRAFPRMQVELDPAPDVATFNRRLNEHDWEGLAHDFAQAPDIGLNAMTYYHSSGGRNYAPLQEPWVDEAAENILQTLDPEERAEHVRNFERDWIEWGPPYLNNGVLVTNHAFQSNMGGVDLVAGTWSFFYTIACYGGLQRFFWRTE